MIEKIITPNQFDIISVGNNSITGFPMFKRFKDLGTINEIKQFYVEFEQWQVCPNGKIYENYYELKRYLIVDITDPGFEYSGYTNWFTTLAPTLLPAINKTLLEMPKESENNYVVQK